MANILERGHFRKHAYSRSRDGVGLGQQMVMLPEEKCQLKSEGLLMKVNVFGEGVNRGGREKPIK